MKFISVSILLILSLQSVSAQSGQWVWMKGDTVYDRRYKKTLPEGIEDSTFNPPSLYLAGSWTDDSGYFYLIGGNTYFHLDEYYDYIWRFDTKTLNWELVKSSNYINSLGAYGTKGIPDSSNYPGSRDAPIIWKDNQGTIWLFGGDNEDYGEVGYNDLWKYNQQSNEWTWMNGAVGFQNWYQGQYGTKGVFAPGNIPPPRREAASWVDDSNDLWLFGGYCNCSGDKFYDDLWEYSPKINQWAWMGGSAVINNPGKYGIKLIPDTSNLPSARSCRCSWTDDAGNFYLYGDMKTEYFYNSLGDVWRYTPGTQQWTWMAGDSGKNFPGISGEDCIYNSNNYPTSRLEPVCVKNKNTVWIFSGIPLWTGTGGGLLIPPSELWKYDIKENEFTKVWGDSTDYQWHYSGLRVIDSASNVRGRNGAVGWLDQSGSLWFYGGDYGLSNLVEADLWKYIPDPNCAVVTGFSSSKINSQLLVYPNPANDNISIKFPFENNLISIDDLYGRELKQLIVRNGNLAQLNIHSLQSGVYIVSIKDEKGNLIASVKLFKE